MVKAIPSGLVVDSLHAGSIFMISLGRLRISFRKIISGIPSGCQTVWIQIRPDILLFLIWVQTICKGYQQTTKAATSRQTVNNGFMMWVKNSVDPGQLDS